VSGKPFPVFMQETVLNALAMSASAYEQPLPSDKTAAAANGSRGVRAWDNPGACQRRPCPVVVAANLEDSNAAGVNGNQSNNSAPNSGAAYNYAGRTIAVECRDHHSDCVDLDAFSNISAISVVPFLRAMSKGVDPSVCCKPTED
jgi:CubicO group peptidase (beta-lactamase class C family)